VATTSNSENGGGIKKHLVKAPVIRLVSGAGTTAALYLFRDDDEVVYLVYEI